MLSVAIAVAAAHALQLHDAWWAAITAFVVMQVDFGTSVYRGLLRVVGTVCGAAGGFLLGPWLVGHPVVFVLLLGFVAWGGLFAGLVMNHSYAWVLALVTFVMVTCEAQVAPQALGGFAVERAANIVLGTVACVLVAAVFDRRWFDRPQRHHAVAAAGDLPRAAGHAAAGTPPSAPVKNAKVDRRVAAKHALPGAVAVALLSAVSLMLHQSAFAQAMVTTIAVLVVPLEGGIAEARAAVLRRMGQRFAGCLLAGAVAFALLPLVEQKPLLCQAVLCLGVWAGAYFQSGDARVRYVATQFSAAFLMVFVQDRGWTVDALPAAQRLAGVFAGIAALSLVFLLFNRHRAAGDMTSNPNPDASDSLDHPQGTP